MTTRPKIQFRQPTADLIPISELPNLLVSDNENTANDLLERIAGSIYKAQLTPRTQDGFPITVADCIEQTKSTRCDLRINEYLGILPDAFKGVFCSPYQHLTQHRPEERLRHQFALGLTLHEHLSKCELVDWLDSNGINCEFIDPIHATLATTSAPIDTAPSQSTSARIISHTIKERRNALDPLLDEAIRETGLDATAIWALFQVWSQEQKPPLLGFDDEKRGIKYRDSKFGETMEPAVLTRKALGERISRRKRLTAQ